MFQDRAGTALFIGGAQGVSVTGNRVSADSVAELRRNAPAILLERCSHLTLRDNSVIDPRPGTTAAIEIGATVASGDDGVQIADLDAQLKPQSEPIADRRAVKQ
jgi:hypothetical protein